MSQLYETPQERAKRLSQSTRTGNWLQDSFTDYVSGGINLGEDGTVKRTGAAWWLQGLTPGARSIAEQKKGLQDSRTIHRAVQDSGLTTSQIRDQLGPDGKLTAGNVSGTIAEATRTRLEKPTPVQQEVINRNTRLDQEATDSRKDSTAVARETLEVTKQSNKDQMTLATNQMELARLDNKFDRETAAADRHLTLRLANMQNDLEDRRMQYDRETRSMDRRDQMIAQLMSGLGSLGGAFSL